MKKVNFRPEIIAFAKKKADEITYRNLSDPNFQYLKAWNKIAEITNESIENPVDVIVRQLHALYKYAEHDHAFKPSDRAQRQVFHQFLKEFNPFPEPGFNLLVEQLTRGNCLPELKSYTGDDPKLVIDFCADYLRIEREDLQNEQMSAYYCDDAATRRSEQEANRKRANLLNNLESQIGVARMAYMRATKHMSKMADNENELKEQFSPK